MRHEWRDTGLPQWSNVARGRRALVLVVGATVAWSCQSSAPNSTAPAFDVMERTIVELAAALESGDVTSRELVTQYLARIDAYDTQGPTLNAMISVNPNALAEADTLDAELTARGPRGLLHGVPVVVKDNYDTADMPTTAGVIALATSVPPDDAFQVQKLRESGAIILGKANMHELARGITTISSFGGQTRNPYDPARNPGGSSGGTGAAVAASLAAMGMGSDTCGSIRIPAAHHALVGLRGTRGLSSRDGIIPLSHTQDIGGPLTRSVEDLAIVLDATVGPDPADESTLLSEGHIPESYTAFLNENGLQGARVGILDALMEESPADQPVREVIEAAVEEMKTQGAEVIEIEEVDFLELLEDSSVIRQEFGIDLATYLQQTPDAPVKSLDEIVEKGLYHYSFERRNRLAMEVESLDTDEYRQAIAKRDEVRQAVIDMLDEYALDAFAYPTIRQTAAPIGSPQSGSNCRLSAISGLPAITVPAGFAENGMPVGVELLGRAFAEPTLITLAYAYEQATHHRRPPVTTPGLVNPPNPLMFQAETTDAEKLAASAIGPSARAHFTLDWYTLDLRYSMSVSGVLDSNILGVHLHRGTPAVPGPMIHLLGDKGEGRVSGTITLSAGDVQDLRQGNLYFDAHTTNRVEGVRGQLIARDQ